MLQSFDSDLEKLDGYETDFVRILYYDLPRNYTGTYRSYGYTRLCTILEGEKHITLKNRDFTYDKSHSLLLPSHSKVHMEIEKPTKALVFELSDELIQSVAKKALPALDDSPAKYSSQELLIDLKERNIQGDICQLMQLGRRQDRREQFLVDLYAQKLVFEFLNSKATKSLILSQTDNPMQRAIDLLKNRVTESISLSEIAGLMHMSESNFSHSFKKHVGMNPQKYIHKLKLDHSLELLTQMSVTEAAYELGYENPSHFIRLFKHEYGYTPKQYQLSRKG